MRVTVNIATQPSRILLLPQVIESLIDQVDFIRLYCNVPENEQWDEPLFNDLMEPYESKVWWWFFSDAKDNGKFAFVSDEPEIYLTCDDDILYPEDYVKTTLENMELYPGHIISYHGRRLTNLNVPYYWSHKQYKFFMPLLNDTRIDVAGTGVCAFNTELFKPKGIERNELKRMSDLLFSLEAAKQKIPIMCCKKPVNWLKPIKHNDVTILDGFKNLPTPHQDELANEIYRLNYLNDSQSNN